MKTMVTCETDVVSQATVTGELRVETERYVFVHLAGMVPGQLMMLPASSVVAKWVVESIMEGGAV